ncbi:hypothetical protein LCGC14_2711140, partial [marine sediment metagenome]
MVANVEVRFEVGVPLLRAAFEASYVVHLLVERDLVGRHLFEF